MGETRTVHDPFLGQDVHISDRLVDRLRGKYASGPHMPNGKPEFGWKQFQAPPIQHEAAEQISRLTEENLRLRGLVRSAYNEGFTEGIREYRTDSGGKPWDESRARSALSKGEG